MPTAIRLAAGLFCCLFCEEMPLTDPGLPSVEFPRIKWGKLYGAATALILAEAAVDYCS